MFVSLDRATESRTAPNREICIIFIIFQAKKIFRVQVIISGVDRLNDIFYYLILGQRFNRIKKLKS